MAHILLKRISPIKIGAIAQDVLFLPSIKQAHMNIHEYQGKEILKSFGVETQRGIVAATPAEAVAAAKKLT